ncbi:sensor histidine kinase [Mangrovimicrobium sediminis]|uniref:sensor histidine kinase n=1 Tax=Mangrovimicrobium sediminis TaxID=2562682 RepID=UPI001F10A76B|nr:HAMP domain-containing sensor histidine kinase [Haliea sp. SAOS-164]
MNRPAILTRPSRSSGAHSLAPFRIYVAYRALVSLVLLIMLVSPNTRQFVGILYPELYIWVSVLYLATNVPLVAFLGRSVGPRILVAIFATDIVAISLMSHASGGVISGIPVLLVITVAASAVLLSNRTLATLIAALSALALLGDTVWFIAEGIREVRSLFPAGLLGALVFLVSLMVQVVVQRLSRAEELARTRASDLYDLQRLNEQIVQHMDTGILLVNDEGFVRVMNKAASKLLVPDRPAFMDQGRLLADYCTELADQFEQWQDNGHHRARPFRVQEDSPSIIAHFRELQPSNSHDSLVFIEDYTPVTQYAQSLKLNSLGRLTASIAHEIRNPLGAISHAAQLLLESEELSDSDQRMAQIIQNHSERVNQIVESVMQISRREPPKPEYLELDQWLESYVREYLQGLNRPADITVDCRYKELIIEFDPENLGRVMTNLLNNALRHSGMAGGTESARIVVELDFVAQACSINVIDNGAGVAPADRAKLFEPFFTTVSEGSGMGLFLCKELCEINNADLSYRPTEQGESCFRIALSQRTI